MLCASSAITMLDEHELVESLNGVFDRGERVDRVLQLLFMGIYFVPFKEGCVYSSGTRSLHYTSLVSSSLSFSLRIEMLRSMTLSCSAPCSQLLFFFIHNRRR